MKEHVIDGQGKILGRVASQAAKLLLSGDRVVLVNAEEIVISGHPKSIIERYKQLVELKDKANPEHSPYWSRRPDLFVKRVVRGMLPYKRPKGKKAYKLLRVYSSRPDGLGKAEDLASKSPSELYESTITIKELSRKLGYNK